MGKPSDLVQGTLDLLILKTVSLEPKHGWAIAKRIQQISGDVLQVQHDVRGPCTAGERSSELESTFRGHQSGGRGNLGRRGHELGSPLVATA
jgi:hypothetical protein